MNTLWTDYPPELSRKALTKHFSHHPEFLNTINDLSRCYICPLAALCDGKTITTSGNAIEADYGISRASAVVQFLRKKMGIPITRELIVIHIDCGMKARQARYSISKNDLETLKKNPMKHSCVNIPSCESEAKVQARKYIQRLVEQHGKDWVAVLLHDLAT